MNAPAAASTISEIPWGVWAAIIGVVIVPLGWAFKRLLWDPLDELRTAQKLYVTQEELDVQMQEFNKQIAAMRTERNEGESRIVRSLEDMQRENTAQRNDTKQDIRALVQRVDTVMQQARH